MSWIKCPPPLLILNIYLTSPYRKKYILSSEELFCPPTESLNNLCSLISGPSLIWLMCLPPFSIFIQLFHSLFAIFFFLLSWSCDLTTLLSALLGSLTLHCCYFLLECNDASPVRKLFCTGYLDAYNRILKRAQSEPKFTLMFFFPFNNYFYDYFPLILSTYATSSSGVQNVKKVRRIYSKVEYL